MGKGEFELIKSCFVGRGGYHKPSTILGMGDDASVHAIDPSMHLVVSTDTSLENVHWPVDFPLDKAADRAVCAALSDLAAMGASPLCIWLNVMARNSDAVEIMAQGATSAIRRYNLELVGGDTCRSYFNGLSVTVAGQLPAGSAMRRDAAEPFHAVWLAGQVGFNALGLQQWQNDQKDGYFVHYLDEIEPRLEDGIRLRELGVRCCIDISDGLMQDAGHIAEASGLGMEIELTLLPGWELLLRYADERAVIDAIAHGGEDYALLFTAPAELHFLEGPAKKIGRCTKERGVRLFKHGQRVSVAADGYDHFA